MVKLRKPFVLGLIFIGIVLSLLNFIPGIQAGSFFGTTTNLDDPELLWWYFVTYGPQYMHKHWLYELNYCLGDPSNCAVVT